MRRSAEEYLQGLKDNHLIKSAKLEYDSRTFLQQQLADFQLDDTLDVLQGCTIGLVSESDTNPIRIGLVIGRTRPRKFWPVRMVNWFRLVNWCPIGRSASSSDRIKRDRTILRTWVDTCRPIKFKAFLINKRPSNAKKLFFRQKITILYENKRRKKDFYKKNVHLPPTKNPTFFSALARRVHD